MYFLVYLGMYLSARSAASWLKLRNRRCFLSSGMPMPVDSAHPGATKTEVASRHGYAPNDDVKLLRKGGATYPIQMEDGTVYMSPGGGYASSGMSDKAIMTVFRFKKRLIELEEYVRMKVDEMTTFAANIDHPFGDRLHFKLRFARDDGEVFRVLEAASGVIFQVGD